MYNQTARYYDLVHADLTADIRYILNLAAETAAPILELGCGTGRLLRPLARAGHTVVGVDNAPEMLAIARARLQEEPQAVQERITLIEGDMAALALPAADFGLAIIPYNTLMHLPPKAMARAFKGIRKVLGENGRLFIDLINPTAVAATPNDRMITLENQLTDPQTGETILQMASNWLDETAQTLQITWIYDAIPANGGAIHRTVAKTLYHYLFPHQLDLLLQDAGFKLQHVAGDYDGSVFDEESGRLLVVAEQE